ncbi:MAG TPA: DUF1697 domain-containing protein, partial [Roseiflexaceae bacterium]|nr:DUF1697 domain-containing protein [Roseiflexaceae bacterium]
MSSAQRYIAFLRAINVGGHVVKMDRLRALFVELGFADVATFIASGNVIFETPEANVLALEAQIERHLHQALGYEVATFIRTPAELATIAATPFPDAGSAYHGLYVSFIKEPLGDVARQRLLALQTENDAFHTQGCEFYWLCRARLDNTPAMAPLLNKA